MTTPIRIGSRRSRLAQKQAQIARDALRTHILEGQATDIITFQTTGDAYLAGNLSEIGNKGLFTKEIEAALLRSEIDIAVHSMKDVATTLPDGLIIPCILPRDDVRDVLLCEQAASLKAIQKGATLGTSSLRRAVQIRHIRPDITITGYRGNLDRRISKLEAGEVDATLLANAGLDRLNMTLDYATPIAIEDMLPAVAQGAIGLQCRAGDVEMIALLKQLNHAPTCHAITAERAMLRALDGTCRTPIAGYATLHENTLHLRGLLATTDGGSLVTHEDKAPLEDADTLGQSVAAALKNKLHG